MSLFSHKARVERALDLILLNQRQLARKLHTIMSAISDYVSKQEAHNASVDASLDAINTNVTDIVSDIGTLNDLITQLQNSSGQISADDQALLDQAEAQGQALQDKATALASAAQAADDLTPPAAPAAPSGS